MPIEIRELSISTTIVSTPTPAPTLSATELQQLKKQLVQDCMKVLKANARKTGFDR